MRSKALKHRHRGNSPKGLDFWQLHTLAAKDPLLLAFFWMSLLLPDLMKTDGKEKIMMVLCKKENPVSQQHSEPVGSYLTQHHAQPNLLIGQRGPLPPPVPCEWAASYPCPLLPHAGAFSRALTHWEPTSLSPVRIWLFCFPLSNSPREGKQNVLENQPDKLA